jgi:hypothetical protein
MLRKTLLFLMIMIVSLSFLITGCDKKPEDTATTGEDSGEDTEDEVVYEPVQAVCIYHYGAELSFREEPSVESKRMGSLTKGEIITFLGQKATGPGDNGKEYEFYKIQRLDGTQGWAWSRFIVPDSKPAVAVENTVTYNQPSDVQINIDFELEAMSIIAIIEDNGNWLKVIYEEKDKTYWIKPGTLSYAEIDIALANKVNLALGRSSDENKIEDLEKLLDIDAFKDSIFINQIHEKLFELENPGQGEDEEPLADMPEEPLADMPDQSVGPASQ